MLKLFGNPGSTCTRKVLMTAHENGAPFEFVLVDMAQRRAQATRAPGTATLWPVPALDDDGFALYESRAMARYIDGKAGSTLTPKDAQARALMKESISIETSNFSPHAMKFIYHFIFKREQPPEVLIRLSQKRSSIWPSTSSIVSSANSRSSPARDALARQRTVSRRTSST